MSASPDLAPLELIEQEICELAACLTGVTARWLSLVAEFDLREGWGGWGVRSCAHWLNWRCGVSLVTAREHVRVAHALRSLPVVQEAFARGALSYSKVRAITRVASTGTEAELVELARHATASHLDRIARAYRGVKQREEDEQGGPERRHQRRYLRWAWDDDGSFTLAGRLSPEEGALVLQALAAAREALSSPVDDTPAGVSRPTAADAMVAMAETVLASGATPCAGGDRHQVVVLVDAGVLAEGGVGRCELDDGPALPVDTVRRLTCDGSVVAASLGDGGEPLSVGRKTRSIPPAIRRALRLRDGGCRFPGCTQRRFVDGHHIVHWSHDGVTSLANLVLLCRAHHRAVHEGGFEVSVDAVGTIAFARPDGTPIPASPDGSDGGDGDDAVARAKGVVSGVTPDTGECLWDGAPMDLGLAIDALLALEAQELHSDAISSR